MVSILLTPIDWLWELRDKRSDDWFLMTSPCSFLWTILICMAYFYLVKAGPRWMANRPALELRQILMGYNLFQILFNGWMFFEMGQTAYFYGQYSLRCQPVDYSETDETALRILRAGYCYFISKFVDFFDTFFFVLRKKNRQITQLHVLHHGLMPIFLWMGAKYVPGGHALFMSFVNTLIHVIMYFYYFVAAMGPRYERFIWWKKYLTTIQMVQFVGVTIHSFQLFFRNECGFPMTFSWMIGGAEFSCLCLFIHFYRMTYHKKIQRRQAGRTNETPSMTEPFTANKARPQLWTEEFRTQNQRENDRSDQYKTD